MAVKVIGNRVFDGKKVYEVGDVIYELSAKEEAALVSDGIVEYTVKGEEIEEVINNEQKNEQNNVENIEDAGLNNEDTKIETIDPSSLELNADEYIKSANKVK